MAWWNFRREQRDNEPQDSGNGLGLLLSPAATQIPTMSLSGVFAAVELISNSIAELPLLVKTTQDNRTTIVTDHPLHEIWHACLQTRFIMMKQLIVDLLLYGNGFAMIERTEQGRPENLIYCPRGTVDIQYNERTHKLLYKVKGMPRLVEPVNMIHLIKNTRDGIHGVGVIEYASCSAELAKVTERAAHDYFNNGLHVAGILTTETPRLTDDQRNKIRQAWYQAHGKSGSGLAVLEGGMQYQPVSSNGRDSQMLETRLFNLQEIARFFNISPVLLGDLSHNSYASIEGSLLEFVTHTLYPYITLVEDELTRKLILPSEHQLQIDLDANFLLKSDKTSQAQYLTSLVRGGIMTINEARQQIGLNDLEGGDELIIPYTNVDQNRINKENKPNTKDEEE